MITDIRNLIAARRDEENDEGGFTLIELLIVIVVLGILAAIVVFAVQNLTGTSAVSACKSDAKTVESAVEAYKAQVGSYPTLSTQLTSQQDGLDGKKVGPWLRSFPENDKHYQLNLGATAPGADDPATVAIENPGNLGQVLVVAPPTDPAVLNTGVNSNDSSSPCDNAV